MRAAARQQKTQILYKLISNVGYVSYTVSAAFSCGYYAWKHSEVEWIWHSGYKGKYVFLREIPAGVHWTTYYAALNFLQG